MIVRAVIWIEEQLKGFRGDKTLNRLLRNAGLLLSGNIGAAVAGFVAVVLAARILGPLDFGRLALMSSYILVVDRLVNFQSWQALIKYGADFIVSGSEDKLKRVLKFGTLLDAGSAAIGTAIAAGGAILLGHLREWDPQTIWLTVAYSGVILFHISGTPISILRLYNRFDLLAIQQIVPPIGRLIGVGIATITSGDFFVFVLAWIIADVVGHVVLILCGWKVLRDQQIIGVFRTSVRGIRREVDGLLSFVLTSNINASIRMTTRELDLLLVGAVLDVRSAGLYKIAKQFALVLSKVVDPLYQAIYPELTKLWSESRHAAFAALIKRSSAFAGGLGVAIWLFFAFLGTKVLRHTAGVEYIDAHGILSVYMLAIVISVWSVPLQPAMLAQGRPNVSLRVGIASTLLYFASFPYLTAMFGLTGAGWAYVLYYLAWSTIMLGLVTSHTRRESLHARTS